ncbi:uncharacterized protein SEPMUDRAFT_45457, partial [Sphaerulina musiva SO2202]
MESKKQHGSDRQSGIHSTFDCVCCCDEYSSVPIHIQDNAVCLECFSTGIVPQFEDALKDETKYPPLWAGHELNLQDYADHVPADLLIRWNEKKEEYLTPVQDRLYCSGTTTTTATPGHRHELASQSCEHSTTQQNGENCGAFLGSKRSIRRSAIAPSCTICSSEVCSKCSKVLSKTRVHDCELDADEDPFKGLVRGRDYQQCPKSSCQIKISLMDGCNLIRCKYCQTDFCFVCAEEVSHLSEHWKVGKPCPRFGFPGSGTEMHD